MVLPVLEKLCRIFFNPERPFRESLCDLTRMRNTFLSSAGFSKHPLKLTDFMLTSVTQANKQIAPNHKSAVHRFSFMCFDLVYGF